MKLKVNNSKTFININIEDIEIYKYPAYPNLFLHSLLKIIKVIITIVVC